MTNINNSFVKTVEGINNLTNQGIKTQLNFLVHKKNYKNISGMIRLAEELKCSHSFSTEFTSRYDNTSLSNIGLNLEEYIELLKSPDGDLFKSENQEGALQCECAKTVCGISSKGEVYPCIGAPIPSGNLKNQGFEEIWRHSNELNKIRNLTRDDFSTCKDCNLLSKCSRSSGGAYVNTGVYTGKNPENCMEANARNILSL
jgi:radical SAM protein with 4Fe4S-binding SPASM domain